MRFVNPAVRILFRKEVRQLLRNRQAIMSAAVMPVLLLVVVPGIQVFTSSTLRGSAPAQIGSGLSPASPRDLVALYLLPLFVCLAGVLAPSVTAVVVIMAERDQRTLELLVALPVRVVDILLAKLLATLSVIAVVTVPLTLLDGAAGVIWLHQGPIYVPLLLLVLLGGLVASICLSTAITLLAREYRTSQQLSGLLVIPILAIANGILLFVPGLGRLVLLAAVLGAGGTLAAWLVVRRISFERYLG